MVTVILIGTRSVNSFVHQIFNSAYYVSGSLLGREESAFLRKNESLSFMAFTFFIDGD